MIEVTATTEIAVPAEIAYAYLADVTNNPEWQDGVQATEWASGSAGEVGASYHQTLDYRGKVTRYKVTAIEPGRSISFESVGKATIPTTVTRSVAPLDADSCAVTVSILGRPRGLRRFAQKRLQKMIQRSTEIDYVVLKRKLEGIS